MLVLIGKKHHLLVIKMLLGGSEMNANKEVVGAAICDEDIKQQHPRPNRIISTAYPESRRALPLMPRRHTATAAVLPLQPEDYR